jgi:hypothetical protein
MTHPHSEKRESLWLLIVSPMIWAAHFMLCYITAAVWCAKVVSRDSSLGPVRWAIAGYTLGALVGIGWNGLSGLRRHRSGSESPQHDFDTPGERHGFLGFATVLLSALSAVATLFAGIVAIYFEDCR